MITYDVAIVGGGIVGLSVAYQLSQQKPGWRICVIEKEDRLAQHQSSRNSGVMHSGIYYRPGSMRARNCREGYERLKVFCEQQGIAYDICGKLIAATDAGELGRMQEVFGKGIQNGLQGLRLIGPDEAREIEPHLQCVKAIKVPQAGIVDYEQVALAYAREFQLAGGDLFTGTKVERWHDDGDCYAIETNLEVIKSRCLVTCAGLYADRLAKVSDGNIPWQIVPFRGEYYELLPERQHLVRHLIYPVPDPGFPFLGVHFTRMIQGGIEAGPNAVLAFRREGYRRHQVEVNDMLQLIAFSGFRKLVRRHWKMGWEEMRRSFSKTLFVKAMQRLVPDICSEDVVPGRSGVRAMACAPDGKLLDDFLITEQRRIVHVINAPSPAATASLAIGAEIVQRVVKQLAS